MEHLHQQQHYELPSSQQISQRVQLQNPISIDQMRDGVVAKATYSRYVNEIIHFLNWVAVNMPCWMTELCSTQYKAIVMRQEGEGVREREKQIKVSWTTLVKKAGINPLIKVDQMTPEGVMLYISAQANQSTGLPLSKSGYNGKRSAIKHFVRCHWEESGWNDDFDTKLEQYWTGFIRGLSEETFTARQRSSQKKKQRLTPAPVHNDSPSAADKSIKSNDDSSLSEAEDDSSGDEYDDDDRDLFREGKIPMTPELFRHVCRWFLEWRSVEGILCACFVAITWHLACRSYNTARIRYSHITWLVFDAMHVRFRHTKSQQHGQARRYKRACYSNPFEWYIDMPFLLGLYLATSFNTVQRRGMRLFPGGGKSQSSRVTNHFKRLLKEHEDEVLGMGYDSIDELGLHSIRKGATTYLSSLPGGPSLPAICRRAGWSLGHVHDLYIFQTQEGDEFAGRCLSMLNMMNGDFGSSPAFFADDAGNALINNAVANVFLHHHEMDGSTQLFRRCLASMVFHRETVLNLHTSHAARSIPLYCQSEMHNELASHVKMVHCWETNAAFTGIPPHIKLLVDMASIKATQERLVEEITTRVAAAFSYALDDRQIGEGALTEGRITSIVNTALEEQLESLSRTITQKFNSIVRTAAPTTHLPTQDLPRSDAGGGQTLFQLRSHRNGILSRLPEDYNFPAAGVYDCWVKWNISDTERGIPPLRLLQAKDFAFIDLRKKTVDDSRGHTGKFKEQRRGSSKIFSDLKYLCKYIEQKASEAGMELNDRSHLNVRLMYEVVEPVLYPPGKNGSPCTQNRWRTVLRKLLKRQGNSTKEL